MKVLCIGSSVLETTCTMDDTLIEGSTVRLSDRIETGGGHAGNIAYLLAKWGVETYIASMLGADDRANTIKKDFENIGVKIDYIETSYDKPTGQTISIVNKVNKNKTILDIVSNSYLKKYSFNFEPDVIVSDGNDYNASVSAFDRYQNAKTFLVISSYRNEVVELSRYVKTVIVNRRTAEAITGLKVDFDNSGTLVNVYNKLRQKFNDREIVITVGERGVVYAINGQVKIMPPIRTKVVDTNGAGDVFAGAYIYGIGRDFGQERSIAYASIAASFSTTKLTSRESIPTLTEVSTYYDSKYGAQNNPIKNVVEIDPHVNMNTQEAPSPASSDATKVENTTASIDTNNQNSNNESKESTVPNNANKEQDNTVNMSTTSEENDNPQNTQA